MFRLEITADTIDDLRTQVREVQTQGGSPLSVFPVEALLEELRSRVRKDGLVVNVEPFAGETVPGSDAAPQAPAPKATKPKSSATKATKAETKAEDTAKTAQAQADTAAAGKAELEAAKPVQAGTATAQAMTETDEQKAARVAAETAEHRGRVVKALEAYATANGGQVAARKVMEEVGGSVKLADIPRGKWDELIDALKVKEAA